MCIFGVKNTDKNEIIVALIKPRKLINLTYDGVTRTATNFFTFSAHSIGCQSLQRTRFQFETHGKTLFLACGILGSSLQGRLRITVGFGVEGGLGKVVSCIS